MEPDNQPASPSRTIRLNKVVFFLALLSGFSTILSLVACILTIRTASQVASLRQTLEQTPQVTGTAIAPSPQPPPQTSQTLPPNAVSLQPGQFVENAFGTKAQVELLAVKLIQNPETGRRDVVNVQLRIRRIADQVGGLNLINVGGTTARNPDTSETYVAVDGIERATETVSLFQMRKGASSDAYVWLSVPEGVNELDIFVPETAGFENVPIS